MSGTNSANTGIKLHIIFDQGSQHSYLSQQVRDALNLNTVTKEGLLINAFSANEEEFKICDKVEIVVGSLFDKFEMKIDTFVVDNIGNPLEKHDLYEIQSKYPHLSNIQLADDSNGDGKMEIDLLIGLDHLWKFMQNAKREAEDKQGPISVKTGLGRILSGPVEIKHDKRLTIVNLVPTHVLFRADCEGTCEPIANESLEEQMQSLWDLDSIGIGNKRLVHESFLESRKFENGRYSVKPPFKSNNKFLPDNYQLSLARLHNLFKSLSKTPEQLIQYDKVIRDRLEKGIVE